MDLALCVITHRVERLRRGHLEVARAALEGGASMIQLREKNVTDRELWALAREMRRMARKRGAGFVVNDRVDIALAAEADGVHLGADDLPVAAARRMLGPGAVIGASVANAEEARAAEAAGATYVSVGSVFETSSKSDAGEAIGIGPIGDIRRATALPVLAIGGINSDNVDAVIRAGAHGVAVISAVSEAGDMVEATSNLGRLIRKARSCSAEQEQSYDTA